ncbi:hypothetical protein [Streptomyces sp. NBRC 110611]|uniref:hypothetical protein n=1 Tax=Streptomyces sp. NBRC 110611 TaxID=1621259 RepID=UPI0008325F88|nr:hypothetical protein [Streptomyces sp. NBRC 110611]
MASGVADLFEREAVVLVEQEAFLLGQAVLPALRAPEVAGGVGDVHAQVSALDTRPTCPRPAPEPELLPLARMPRASEGNGHASEDIPLVSYEAALEQFLDGCDAERAGRTWPIG